MKYSKEEIKIHLAQIRQEIKEHLYESRQLIFNLQHKLHCLTLSIDNFENSLHFPENKISLMLEDLEDEKHI